MEIRDIIVWIGLIAIVVIVVDGIRRMNAGRPRRPVKKDHYVDPEEAKKKAEIARELPNGGARVREMTEVEKDDLSSRLNLRERVPMLMERVEVETPEAEEEPASVVQSELDFSAAMADLDEPDALGLDSSEEMSARDEEVFESQKVAPSGHNNEPEPANKEQDGDGLASGNKLESERADDSQGSSELAESEALEEEPAESALDSTDQNEPVQDPGPVEDLVVIHVMARNKGELSGSAVLDLLITAGLRHGPMDIFHYRNPKGVTEFSLANCVQPGTFDPDGMNQVNTPGVTLFMQLPTLADALESFDHMHEMAQFLAKHLDAEILDEDHSSVTNQRIEYYREKIRSFERSKLIPS